MAVGVPSATLPPNPQSPSLAERRLFVFTVDQELLNGNRSCIAEW